ncbi:hypothetical protein AA0498_1985 [Acidomonas methanolica]|uniref:Type I restriction-modification system R subunit n=1 Tax=Acidomonas methanolica NBRC 104435 TaxID=1231351 RepID=A0A023D9I9_ACIMT|nr:type I restriction enzyme endonuclease domain-containing protein [Acidomonas methanolica]TCS18017.1 uncharacterized protein DUF3387 [Acidomonas methanolica]GAJ30794.1 type I restriction-modification system R subunit [Acidomonas methanolica NBRC 104435]GBQ53676.1 hypothetical protein AA0498_1985 [Acidomonas methanolica]GEL00767.1 hypothetical protein AME01nite_32650 [Acidomonas methanolica NBRC 104435]
MASEYVDKGIPFLRSLNIEPLNIKCDGVKFITPSFHKRLQKSSLRPGDVVIVRTGKPGTCAAIPDWLEQAVGRYHTNALTSAQILDELIRLAHEMAAARSRGEELGLSPEEVAFYDALARNDSAREAMGDPGLRVIAAALVKTIRENATVDWNVMAPTRARMRTAVKRLLRKYGYPPDMQDEAVQNILRQAEEFAPLWAGSGG